MLITSLNMLGYNSINHYRDINRIIDKAKRGEKNNLIINPRGYKMWTSDIVLMENQNGTSRIILRVFMGSINANKSKIDIIDYITFIEDDNNIEQETNVCFPYTNFPSNYCFSVFGEKNNKIHFKYANVFEMLVKNNYVLTDEILGINISPASFDDMPINITLTGNALVGRILLPANQNSISIHDNNNIQQSFENFLNNYDNEKLVEDNQIQKQNSNEINSISIEEFDNIVDKIKKTNVYNVINDAVIEGLVGAYRYLILGAIKHIDFVINPLTNKKIWLLDIEANTMNTKIIVSSNNLEGNPKIGRRFFGFVEFVASSKDLRKKGS